MLREITVKPAWPLVLSWILSMSTAWGQKAGDIPGAEPNQPDTAVTSANEVVEPNTDVDGEVPAEHFEPHPQLRERVSVSSKLTEAVQLSAANVTVITADQIARAGYRNVGEALAVVPGLYVSHDQVNYHVAVRGVFGGARAGSRSLKVMINGNVVSFVTSGSYFLGSEMVPIQAVERIEVMKGPASALYGAGALVGAINIVTKRDPYEVGQTTVKVRAQALGEVGGAIGGSGSAMVTLASQSIFALLAVSGAYEDRSGLRLPASSPVLADESLEYLREESREDIARPIAMLGRAEIALLGGRLDLDFVGQLHDYSAEFSDVAPLSHETRISLFHWKAAAGYERAFAGGLTLLTKVGLAGGAPTGSDQFVKRPDSEFAVLRDFGYLEFSGQAEGRYEISEHAWVMAGADLAIDTETLTSFSDKDLRTGEIDPLTPEADIRRLANFAGYTQVFWSPIQLLRLTGAFRYDHHNIYGGAVSGRAGIVLWPMDRLSLKALCGRSYRAPSAEQLFSVPLLFGDLVGDASLKPQFLNGGELVLDWFITADLNLSAAFFYNKLEGGIAYVRLATDLAPVAYDATSIGGEIALRQASDLPWGMQLITSAAVSLQSTKTDDSKQAGSAAKLVPDNEAVPELSCNLSVALQLARIYARVFANYRYVGSRTPSQTNLALADPTRPISDPAYTLDGYHLLDLGVGSLPIPLGGGSLGLMLKVQNATNSDYVEIGFNGVDVPSLGTTAWLQATLTI